MVALKPTLSVILITKNESLHIRRCLESIKWADEIIVLDSGSEDDTVAICQEYTQQVFVTDWPGFGPQKNRALAKATHTWVLSLDADEWLPKSSQQEIQTIIHQDEADFYYIRRQNVCLGQVIKHGDYGNDRVIRLFKRELGKFTDNIVHESVITSGRIKQLKEPLIHTMANNLEELVDRLNRYTTLAAEMNYRKGKSTTLLAAIAHGVWAFIKSYILRGGFLEGAVGFLIAMTIAENCYYKYVKLLLMTQQPAKTTELGHDV